MTRLADLLPRNVQPHLGAANGLPEIDVQPVFEIASSLRLRRCRPRPSATPEELAENIAEPKSFAGILRPARAARRLLLPQKFAEIESPEIRPCARAGARPRSIRRNVIRIKPVLVVNFALLIVAQNVIRFLNFLEALFCCFIAWIQIRMVLARKLPVGLANLIRIRAPADTQGFVIILLRCSRHCPITIQLQ